MGIEQNQPIVAQMIPLFPPVWAEVFGEDDFGIFAEFEVEGITFVWRWIPPGRFRMGSPEDEKGKFDWDEPQHQVTITEGFWLGETPVTQAQWKVLEGDNPSRFKGDQRPVEQVSCEDCQRFIQKLGAKVEGLGGSLPSEAQWEYACRARTVSAFNDGSECTKPAGKDPALDRLGWFDGNSRETNVVKKKLPNAWGLYDMHGNVWEWCLDGMRDYSKEDQENPLGALDGASRVIRGGSWGYNAWSCRSASRIGFGPESRGGNLGFRLAAGQPRLGSPVRSGQGS